MTPPIRNIDSVFFKSDLQGSQFLYAALFLFGWMSLLYIGLSALIGLLLLAFASYAFTRNVDWSAPLRLGDNSVIDHIRFYEHAGVQFLARDFLLSTYIFLPKDWRANEAEDPSALQCRLTHEIGHCHNMDLSKVTGWYVFYIPITLATILLVSFIAFQITETISDNILKYGLLTFLIGLIVAQLYWVSRTPNLILLAEHRADAFAQEKLGSTYTDFLNYKKLVDEIDPPKKSLLDKFTHPSWKRRAQFFESDAVITPSRAFLEGAAAMMFLAFPPLLLLCLQYFSSSIAVGSVLFTLIGLFMMTFSMSSKVGFLFDAAQHFAERTNYFLLGSLLPFIGSYFLVARLTSEKYPENNLEAAAILMILQIAAFALFLRKTSKLRSDARFMKLDDSIRSFLAGFLLLPLIFLMPHAFSHWFVILFATWKLVTGVLGALFMLIMLAMFEASKKDPESEQIFSDFPAFAMIRKMVEVHPEGLEARNTMFGHGAGISEFGRAFRTIAHRLLLWCHGSTKHVDPHSYVKHDERLRFEKKLLYDNNQKKVRGKKSNWTTERAHSSHKNIIAAGKNNHWMPAPGYGWVAFNNSWEVEWKPGQKHPFKRFHISDAIENQWVDLRNPQDEQRILSISGMLKDKVTTNIQRRAPNTVGNLFSPEELDIYVNRSTYEVFVFHGKVVDYRAIDYFEYHTSDFWVAVIMKDGCRLDLGVQIQWLIRPLWLEADEVKVVRTKDGQSIEGATFTLRRIYVPGQWMDEYRKRKSTVITSEEERHEGGERVKLLPPPNVDGMLFPPGETGIGADKDTNECHIFHTTKINYDEIDHIVYSTENCWLVAVMRGGSSVDLGTHVKPIYRKYWQQADRVTMIRRKGPIPLDSRVFVLRKPD